jgi:predicted TIM-barrel fold metal-dependent hydrolase
MVQLTLQNVPLISADSHVNEPPGLWQENLPSRLRDRAPRAVKKEIVDGARRKTLVMAGDDAEAIAMTGWDTNVDRAGAAASQQDLSGKPPRHAHNDPIERARAQDLDGVTAEVIFPSTALFIWGIADRELGAASCRVYNDWIANSLATSERFSCPALIPVYDPDEAVEEMRRGKAIGLKAAMIPMVASPTYNYPQWEKLWQAAEELGMPICAHQGTGHDMLHYRGWGSAGVNYLTTQSFAARTAGLFANSGILERHPDLKVALVECAGGWLAWVMQALDESRDTFMAFQKPQLAHPPSYYLKRQVFVTFQRDEVAVNNRNLTGVQPLMWGNDYPHHEGTFPHSRATIARVFAGVPIEDAEAILGGNCARLFGLEHLRQRKLAEILGATALTPAPRGYPPLPILGEGTLVKRTRTTGALPPTHAPGPGNPLDCSPPSPRIGRGGYPLGAGVRAVAPHNLTFRRDCDEIRLHRSPKRLAAGNPRLPARRAAGGLVHAPHRSRPIGRGSDVSQSLPQAPGREGLARRRLAGRVRRPEPHLHRAGDLQRGAVLPPGAAGRRTVRELHRPLDHPLRQRGSEAAAPGRDHARRIDLVPGLLRAQLRLRPGLPPDPRPGRR